MYTAPFTHDRIKDMDIYSQIFITTVEHVVKVEPIHVCFILSCEKEAIYMWQNSFLTFYTNTLQRKLFTKF